MSSQQPSSDSAGVISGPRPRRKKRNVTRWIVAFFLVAASIALLALMQQGRHPAVGKRPAASPLAENQNPADSPFAASQAENQSPQSLGEMITSLHYGVVKIETHSAGGNRSLGSGFVIDRSGLIATNYHVIAEATQAVARFPDGLAYTIAGYRGVDVQHDLAILQLTQTPARLTVLPLQPDDPDPLSKVVAIGHPHGAEFSPYDGAVSRVLSTSQLPQQSREFVRQQLGEAEDRRWIQHTARISQGSSGGPLINPRGEVLGINTWVDSQTAFSYAIHAEHLQQLRQKLFPKIAPLEAYARSHAQAEAILAAVSAESLRQWKTAAEEFQFAPRDENQYAVLQRLAWGVSVAELPTSFEGEIALGRIGLETLHRESDVLIESLRTRKWDGVGMLAVINDFAARQLTQPDAGLFCFATVERIVSGPEGSRGAIFTLAGGEENMFVPLDGRLSSPAAGDTCLVLGVNYHGQVVRYGENPLDLIEAPIIAAGAILPLPK